MLTRKFTEFSIALRHGGGKRTKERMKERNRKIMNELFISKIFGLHRSIDLTSLNHLL